MAKHMTDVNDDQKPRDRSGYGQPKSTDRDRGQQPPKKSISDGVMNSQGTDKVNSRTK